MIIIGEKINGSIPSVAKAIESKNEDYIRRLAKRQSEAGADYIDICASVSDDLELETMKWLIDLVQDTVDTPICIDSPNPQVCVDCIPFCKKEGIINSVSLEGDKIEIIFPAIADTGWQVVALLCDNYGIPSTVDKRLQIAKQLMSRADEYGIEHSRIYIDPLVIALATDGESMAKFEACTRQIKEWYPDVHITSGLSNISFGLPARKIINMAFMALAMNAGMDSAIVDPLNRDMLGIILATDALTENDEYCLNYIKAFRQGRIGNVTKK
ncbi:MAG: methyltetrahydrofolate cobalamin methyltransferase [Eubacteriales bacterium]|jgi:5-methyltetrahydrofolate corrinoid/iron sulfur protein methyltransferase